MSKEMRIQDFQIRVGPAGLPPALQRSIHASLFATYEPVRLWLKDHATKAPFRKLLVTLADESAFGDWHGNVSSAGGVCEVTEAVRLANLERDAEDHRWVISIVRDALSRISRRLDWECGDLETELAGLAMRDFPLEYSLESFSVHEKKRKLSCRPWISTRPGLTEIGVDVQLAERMTRMVVRSAPGPLFLEDDFPIARLKLSNETLLWLDRRGRTLAISMIDNNP